MNARLLAPALLVIVALAAEACASSSPTDAVPADTLPAFTDSLQARYWIDASTLALREVQKTAQPAAQPVEIPAALTTTFYRGLVGVYDLGTAQVDSIIRLYAIHTGGNPPVNSLIVRVDTMAAWAAPWRAKQALTGKAAIDSLVTHYQLSIASVTRLSALKMGDMFGVHSAGAYNMLALAQRFEATGLVIAAEPNGIIGGGSDITAARQGDGWRLDFILGWGDCPAGCIEHHTWSFLALDSGGVRFIGSSGPAVPKHLY